MSRTWEYKRDDITDTDFTLVEPGDYVAMIEDAVETTAKTSGRPLLVVSLKINWAGREWTIKDFMALGLLPGEIDTGIMRRTRQFFDVIGAWNRDGQAVIEPEKWVGQYVKIILTNRSYKRKDTGEQTTNNSIKTYLALTTPTDREESKKLTPF